MATGGAGPEEAGQGSPVVMKKMVPVQSTRPQPAPSASLAQQGETQSQTLTQLGMNDRKLHLFSKFVFSLNK